ncbi:MAG: transposase, partial [Chromatocurvus sp.]
MRTWLDASFPSVPPGTLTGKAVNYLHNEWPKLIRYLEDGRLKIDNDLAKNAIRPFVIGRIKLDVLGFGAQRQSQCQPVLSGGVGKSQRTGALRIPP